MMKKNTSKLVSVVMFSLLISLLSAEVFAATTKTTTTTTTTTTDVVTTTTTVTVTKEHAVTTNTGTNANNPSSDVAAKSTGTGTGKSTTAATTTTTTTATKVSNFTSLRRKTALEKKAYKHLKKIEKLAKKYGWNVKRTYTREKLAKQYKKVWCITDVYLQGKTYNWSFRHCYHKSGRVTYQWKGKTIAQADVYGLIKNPSKYYK